MLYGTIVVDPPWHYDAIAGGTPGKIVRRQALPYPSMTVDEIAALPVAALAMPDAWLALWTTNRYLPSAFDVLEAWGFQYRQTMVWNKQSPSPLSGTLASNAAEYLLIAARGGPRVKRRWPTTSVIWTPKHPHSQKPTIWNDLLEWSCEGPYLELFARRHRSGWETWGNQAATLDEDVSRTLAAHFGE